MKKSLLSLKFHFLTSSKLIAAPVDDVDESTAPELRFIATINSAQVFTLTASVKWGEELKSPYFIEAEMLGVFEVKAPPERTSDAIEDFQRWYTALAVNASQIIYNALRSHIATLTAIGPHRTRFLPTIVIEQEDVELSADEGLIQALQGRPQTTAAKETKKKKIARRA